MGATVASTPPPHPPISSSKIFPGRWRQGRKHTSWRQFPLGPLLLSSKSPPARQRRQKSSFGSRAAHAGAVAHELRGSEPLVPTLGFGLLTRHVGMMILAQARRGPRRDSVGFTCTRHFTPCLVSVDGPFVSSLCCCCYF